MNTNLRHEEIERILAESSEATAALGGMLHELGRACELVAERIRSGGCLLAFGNGGSAAESQHMAAELVGTFSGSRPGLAALALTSDTATLTALGNDFGFDQIFARQVQAYGSPGDVLIVITTSGNSKNIIRAVEEARRKKMKILK